MTRRLHVSCCLFRFFLDRRGQRKGKKFSLRLVWLRGHGDDQLLILRMWKPILGRRFYVPNISGDFKLQCDIENFAVGARPLDPDHSSWESSRGQRPSLSAANLDGEPGILWDVVLRLILAAVAVHRHG